MELINFMANQGVPPTFDLTNVESSEKFILFYQLQECKSLLLAVVQAMIAVSSEEERFQREMARQVGGVVWCFCCYSLYRCRSCRVLEIVLLWEWDQLFMVDLFMIFLVLIACSL